MSMDAYFLYRFISLYFSETDSFRASSHYICINIDIPYSEMK